MTEWMITCVFLIEKFQDMLSNPHKKGQMGLRNIRIGVVFPSATGQATIEEGSVHEMWSPDN
jgi:hypothetical protein